MMKVEIQKDNWRRFIIPVPYCLLHLMVPLISSKFLWRQANKWIHYDGDFDKNKRIDISLVNVDSKRIKYFLNTVIEELRCQKGLVIVNVTSHDGYKVVVKL